MEFFVKDVDHFLELPLADEGVDCGRILTVGDLAPLHLNMDKWVVGLMMDWECGLWIERGDCVGFGGCLNMCFFGMCWEIIVCF